MILYSKQFTKYYNLTQILKYIVLLSSVVLIIDLLNLPSRYLINDYPLLTIILLVTIIALIIIKVIELHLIDTMKITSINFVDCLSVVIVFACSLYISVIQIITDLSQYKLMTSLVIIGFSLYVLGFRVNKISNSIKLSNKYKANFIDLIDLYNGDFEIDNGETIFFKEKDVDYDLLDRQNVINMLYSTIKQSTPDEGFVISLEGKWGSGKSTIINNVKNKIKASNKNEEDNIIVIDTFDPWAYSDQESLYINMFDEIISKSGFKYSSLSTKEMANIIFGNISNTKKINLLKSLLIDTESSVDLKNKINDYLKLHGKKFVFFIDNIERTDSENVMLLFKLVGNVFDFERVIYVLSFDDERVKKIFNHNLNIDYQYLKKIIQMPIRVPEVDKNILTRVLRKSLQNLLIAYGESQKTLNECRDIIEYICKETDDIRDFKRFLNSVTSRPFRHISYLDKRDVLTIEFIRLNNLSLHQQIYQNRKYFITYDQLADNETVDTLFNNEQINEEGKAFFEGLLNDPINKKYIDLLKDVFPYVKRYQKGQDLVDGFQDETHYKDVAKNKRICSGKYFDLYFTHTINDYILIGDEVENFVKVINTKVEFSEKEKELVKILNSIPLSYQKEFFERLQVFIGEFNDDSIFDLAMSLFNNINNIADTFLFMALSARERVEVIVWETLQLMNEEEYQEFLNAIKDHYGKIRSISRILYWFNKDRQGLNVEGRKEKLDLLYQQMGQEIISKSINLYDDKYYTPKNIIGFYSIYEGNNYTIKEYIEKVVNKNNIFRLLNDIMQVSVGTEIRYSFKQENIELLTTEDYIDKLLQNAEPQNNDQKFILEVYQNYKNGDKDYWGDTGIAVNEQYKLNP